MYYRFLSCFEGPQSVLKTSAMPPPQKKNDDEINNDHINHDNNSNNNKYAQIKVIIVI